MSLRVDHLHKSYRMGHAPLLHILRGVNYTFQSSTTFAICGASGCGKSTLLHLLGGLDRPDRGQIFWKDEPISNYSSSKLAEWRNRTVGLIFQSYHLLPELSALENVLLPAALGRTRTSNLHSSHVSRAEKLLEEVGLKKRMHHRPNELSGGEQQRVTIARALMNDPPLLLADEPTGNLDPKTADKVADLIFELAENQKKCLIVVTHDKQLAERASIQLELADGILSSTH